MGNVGILQSDVRGKNGIGNSIEGTVWQVKISDSKRYAENTSFKLNLIHISSKTILTD